MGIRGNRVCGLSYTYIAVGTNAYGCRLAATDNRYHRFSYWWFDVVDEKMNLGFPLLFFFAEINFFLKVIVLFLQKFTLVFLVIFFACNVFAGEWTSDDNSIDINYVVVSQASGLWTNSVIEANVMLSIEPVGQWEAPDSNVDANIGVYHFEQELVQVAPPETIPSVGGGACSDCDFIEEPLPDFANIGYFPLLDSKGKLFFVIIFLVLAALLVLLIQVKKPEEEGDK